MALRYHRGRVLALLARSQQHRGARPVAAALAVLEQHIAARLAAPATGEPGEPPEGTLFDGSPAQLPLPSRAPQLAPSA